MTGTRPTIPIIFLFLFSGQLLAKTLEIGIGKMYANLQPASQDAAPGDTLLFYPGVYSGGQAIGSLQGTTSDWIVVKSESNHAAIIRGGSNAWHLSDPVCIHISGFIFEGQTGNGLNVDDGGDYSTPAHDIVFENCLFRDINATQNNDLLKLSGVDFFQIKNCLFENGAAGGSGIDMVGCHNGEIQNCQFENMGSNAIQAKGGSQYILIQANRFENCGQRSLNLGGSTGLAFFRPADAPFEAADIKVYANAFIGSQAPIAYVGCLRTDVVNNTIVHPEKWVVRILQETVDPDRFFACGDNSFRNNLIYLGEISTETNIGPDTDPQSFEYLCNFWFNYKNVNWRGPDTPVKDPEQVVNKDPQFRDVNGQDFRLQSTSPAIGLSDYSGEPQLDYAGIVFHSPRSVGAFEGHRSTGLKRKSNQDSGFNCRLQPNPFNGVAVFKFQVQLFGLTRLRIYDMMGRQLVELVNDELAPGHYQYVHDFQENPSGVYLYKLENGGDVHCGKMTLLKSLKLPWR